MIKRSVVIDGRKTSVSLEDAFWTALKEIARSRGTTVSALASRIKHEGSGSSGVSSGLRLLVLAWFRNQADAGASGAKHNVLVVDDDPLVLEATAAMLGDLGCEVATAADGMEALRKITSDRAIDVVITDINMPGLSGYELAERAKGMRQGLHVILLSGREVDGRGLPLIRKPFGESDLKRVLMQTAGAC